MVWKFFPRRIKDMPKTNGKSNLLIVSDSPSLVEDIKSALKDEKDFNVLEPLDAKAEIGPAIVKVQPEIVLLDFNLHREVTYDLVDKLASQFPAIAVVVILPEADVHNSDKVVLSGARAFILYPFTKKNLMTSLRRVVELLKRNFPTMTSQDLGIPAPVKPKNTFTVFSPKGGTGCTSIAVNLAVGLRQIIKESLLLVDGKHLFGHVAMMLNLRTANSITDLISHAGMLDQQLINQVVVDHVSGMKVLPNPSVIAEAQGIRPEDLFKVITELQSTFSVIIIDGGNYLNENTVTYMDASERIILVLNPNLASIRDTRQFMEVARSLSYPAEKIMLVLNNTGHKPDIRKDEVEKILKAKVTCEIPSDENFAINSINEGVPMTIKNPRHPVSKAIQELAGIVKATIVDLNTAYSLTENRATTEILRKTSKLG
jgi:pilus assembly protein CpaE